MVADKDPVHLKFYAVTFHCSRSWYSSPWMKGWVSSVYLFPAEKKAGRLFPVWNMKSLFLWNSARWSCCIMHIFQPVWILSVSGCVNSPPLSLSLPFTLTAEIMSFQVNLNLSYIFFDTWPSYLGCKHWDIMHAAQNHQPRYCPPVCLWFGSVFSVLWFLMFFGLSCSFYLL